MAKYETTIKGDLIKFVNYMEDEILSSSSTASLEEKSFVEMNGVKVAVYAYERYSMLGGNRVSLTLTAVGNGDDIWVNAVSTGGSQGMFVKFNTFGEESFLEIAVTAISKYK